MNLRILEYIIRRSASSLLVLLGLTVITFFIARVIPSNPAALYIGPKARQDDIARIEKQLGLDHPLPVQYAFYMKELLRGDLGTSISTKRPITREITTRLPVTLELLLYAMLLTVAVGIPIGVLSARWQGRWMDLLIRVISIIGVSMPAFWLGLLLQVLLVRNLELFPLSGQFDSDLRFTNPITAVTGFVTLDTLLSQNWVGFKDVLWHMVLPAITLAAYSMGLVARMTRATMLEVISQDYIRMARAYGLKEGYILFVSALKNAIGPTLTVLGLTIAYLLTGSFFVEIVYNLPGLGQLTVRSLLNLDYPAIMGITLFGAVGYVIINLLVDLAHAWIDPREDL